MAKLLRKMMIRSDQDMVRLRQLARQVAQLLGFDHHDQIRIATSTSEIGRNTLQYAQEGSAEFFLQLDDQPSLEIIIADQGQGIHQIDQILNGNFNSESGLGLGILGAQRLMDEFKIESSIGLGTTVTMRKFFPSVDKVWDHNDIAQLSNELLRLQPDGPYQEFQRQNQELLKTLADLNSHQAELSQLNKELEDTNSGVVALYSELDEKSKIIQRNSETKNRFLSNISHELRTPTISIIALARMLLEQSDGPLLAEQQKQVSFILEAATSLQEMVNDLLDLAKASAGKISVRVTSFSINQIFSTVRGMMKPLLAGKHAVTITFDEADQLPWLKTDEAKVSQILRNFISNAIKYTEQGEIRISARMIDADTILISVRDTGIGIDPKFHFLIFEEFEQIEGPLQAKQKGTGLGLPVSRKLAEFLGGEVLLKSSVGMGSEFSLRVPIKYRSTTATKVPVSISELPLVLVIDDDEISRYLIRDALKEARFTVTEASSGLEGLNLAKSLRPHAIILDVIMPIMNGFEVLDALKADPNTTNIPIFLNTSKILETDEAAFVTGKIAGVLPKNLSSREEANSIIRQALSQCPQVNRGNHG